MAKPARHFCLLSGLGNCWDLTDSVTATFITGHTGVGAFPPGSGSSTLCEPCVSCMENRACTLVQGGDKVKLELWDVLWELGIALLCEAFCAWSVGPGCLEQAGAMKGSRNPCVPQGTLPGKFRFQWGECSLAGHCKCSGILSVPHVPVVYHPSKC